MTKSTRIRGFEPVSDAQRANYRTHGDKLFKNYVMVGEEPRFFADVKLPQRSDPRSAGYDFYLPAPLRLEPRQKIIVWSDVKAYMQDDEVLMLYIRSSAGIKHGLMFPNNVGVIDASYYSNEGNDGNIGIALVNTTGITVNMDAGDRICQGIFTKYLIADDDDASGTRTGGIGSSGK